MTIGSITNDLIKEIDPKGELRISACYQCGKCSSGCPMHFESDLLPHQLIRLIQMGATEAVIGCKTIWKCASCATCVSRCPMNVRTPEIIDAIRAMSAKERKSNNSVAFNEAFLASVRRFGRVYEPGMLGAYKLRSKDFFADMSKLPTMLAKGKLKLIPPTGADKATVKQIFVKVKESSK